MLTVTCSPYTAASERGTGGYRLALVFPTSKNPSVRRLSCVHWLSPELAGDVKRVKVIRNGTLYVHRHPVQAPVLGVPGPCGLLPAAASASSCILLDLITAPHARHLFSAEWQEPAERGGREDKRNLRTRGFVGETEFPARDYWPNGAAAARSRSLHDHRP